MLPSKKDWWHVAQVKKNTTNLSMKTCSHPTGNMDIFYNYIFHYNPHTQKWYGIHRDQYMQYWSDQTIAVVGDTVGEVQKKILDGLTNI